jgi:putative membrane protein
MRRQGFLALALVAALTAACNNGAKTDNAVATTAPAAAASAPDLNKVGDDDRDYVQDAMAAGDAEVALAKLASTKGVSADVKRYAAMMVADHTKAGEALKAVAATHNVQFDASRKPKDADKFNDLTDKLSKDSAKDFDKDYIEVMVQTHGDVVDMLEKRVDSNASLKDKVTGDTAKDTNVAPEKSDNHVTMAVNQWAADTLPTARHHLDEAKMLQDRLNKKK